MKTKKTSQEWYDGIKNDPFAVIDWLKDQYHGEVTAAERIRSLILRYDPPVTAGEKERFRGVVELIASQEENHATWVGELLLNRGIEPAKLVKDERYWDSTVKQIEDWDTGCAVAAHAEKMRLERIRVIVSDPVTEQDIKDVFRRILVQEEFHERSFREFTTTEAMAKTLEGHLAGLNELGLNPPDPTKKISIEVSRTVTKVQTFEVDATLQPEEREMEAYRMAANFDYRQILDQTTEYEITG